MNEETKPKDDIFVIVNGVPTNAGIHNEILDNDEAEDACRRQTYERLKAAGASEGILSGYL